MLYGVRHACQLLFLDKTEAEWYYIPVTNITYADVAQWRILPVAV
jgi:hypothetical protein